jgi:hypothetical protein
MARGRGPTLAERARPAATGQPASRRHCWVVDAPGHPGRYPGLLAEWRQVGNQWEGRVVYAMDEAATEARLVERWVPAACLEPT